MNVIHNILSVDVSKTFPCDYKSIHYMIQYYIFSNGYVAIVEDKNGNITGYTDLRKKIRLTSWKLENNKDIKLQQFDLKKFEQKFFNSQSIVFVLSDDMSVQPLYKLHSTNIRGVFRLFGKSDLEIKQFKQKWQKSFF